MEKYRLNKQMGIMVDEDIHEAQYSFQEQREGDPSKLIRAGSPKSSTFQQQRSAFEEEGEPREGDPA